MVQIYDSCFHCLKQSHLWTLTTLVRILSNCVVSFLVLKTIWTRIRSDKFCWQHTPLKMKGSSLNKSGLWAASLPIYHHHLSKNILSVVEPKLVKAFSNFLSVSRWLPKLVKFPCWWLPILGSTGGQWLQRWRLLFEQIIPKAKVLFFIPSSSMWPFFWQIPRLCLLMLSCFLLENYISLHLTSY